ncbi:hypothetical protein GCM10027047_00160 [Rhodococcus aerolatus]
MTAAGTGVGAGFDEEFLGVRVGLPAPVDPVPVRLLAYTHFSVLLRPDRRLAAVTGVGIDGDTVLDLPRSGIDWEFDPRVPVTQQTGPQVYAGNDFDRGHLVRRRDAVWGPRPVAVAANVDTFHFTNAAPQAAVFNQGPTLWAGLEDYLLANAATQQRRLVVFTGPVLHPDDPVYRGVQVPRRFFKVAAFLDADDRLGATGYLLDQTTLIAAILAVGVTAGAPVSPGEFLTYQVPIADIAELTGLGLAQLAAADRLPAPTTATGDGLSLGEHADLVGPGWRRLHQHTDITLGR